MSEHSLIVDRLLVRVTAAHTLNRNAGLWNGDFLDNQYDTSIQHKAVRGTLSSSLLIASQLNASRSAFYASVSQRPRQPGRDIEGVAVLAEQLGLDV